MVAEMPCSGPATSSGVDVVADGLESIEHSGHADDRDIVLGTKEDARSFTAR